MRLSKTFLSPGGIEKFDEKCFSASWLMLGDDETYFGTMHSEGCGEKCFSDHVLRTRTWRNSFSKYGEDEMENVSVNVCLGKELLNNFILTTSVGEG
jgi:hypothetical protein